MRQASQRLVREQMQNMDKNKDYIANLNKPVLKFLNSEFIQAEINRVIQKNKDATSNDKLQFDLNFVPESNTEQAARKVLEKAKIAQVTHEDRKLNLELEKEFGKKVWVDTLES